MASNNIGLDAKDVALHFYERKGWRVDAKFGRSVNTVKALLRNGYTKQEIIKVIDYIFDKTTTDMYSIGFVNHVINDTLEKINKLEAKQYVKQQTTSTPLVSTSKEEDSGSSERNRAKISRNHNKSNIGEKYNFNLFEG